MEPPSSDAEPLRDQQTAQVGAANGLLVAADELRNLKRRHQAIGQPAVHGCRVGRELPVDRQYAPTPDTRASSWPLRSSLASNPSTPKVLD